MTLTYIHSIIKTDNGRHLDLAEANPLNTANHWQKKRSSHKKQKLPEQKMTF